VKTPSPLVLGALMLVVAGCPLSHGDYASLDCTNNQDCFTGQGERCNTATHRCETGVDAGPDGRTTDASIEDADDALTSDDGQLPDGEAPPPPPDGGP
jgi:hypothetical protein